MCGICGFSGDRDEALLERMSGCLIHRGPDSGGKYIDEDIGLGIRRLSIIDLKTGDQPIYNEDKTLVIVFNGEIYNFRELRENLEKKGHHFYTKTDTEVIVHLYEDYKDGCVDFLRGMFAFAVWDKTAKRLFLARDRIGEKPLYYTFQSGRFFFASELKALLENKSLSRQINLESLDYYLRFLYVPAPLSIFKGIYKLLPGHTLVWEDNKIKIERYWDLKLQPAKNLSEEDLAEQIRGNLKEAVGLRLISDVPLGVFLSGGIDSGIIIAMMRQVSGSEIDTFSLGFDKKYAAYNELEYSRLLADYFATDHQEFIVNPEIVKLLPKIVWHLDEPFGDSSAILTYLISHQARKYVTVALSGIGGDELFAGYPRYAAAKASLYYQNLPYFLRFGFSRLSTKDTRGRLSRFLRDGILPERERYINWLSVFTDETRKNLYSGSLNAVLEEKKAAIHAEYFNRTTSLDYLERIFYLDVNTYLPDDLLFMADRMSMANYLELRAPLCDHKLMEFCASIPGNLKVKNFRLKNLLKNSLKGILPGKILRKKKQGFMVPIGEWFKGELKGYLKEILSEENIRKRGYFNPAFVKRMLNEHFEGKRIYTHQLWALLIFELWARRFIDES